MRYRSKKSKVARFFLFFVFVVCLISCGGNACKKRVEELNKSSKFVELEGSVGIKKEMRGTLSEFSYFFVSTKNEGNVTIFNQQSYSLGFDKFVGRKVRILGSFTKGFVGNKRERKKGFKVVEVNFL